MRAIVFRGLSTRATINCTVGAEYALNRAYTANGLNQYSASGSVTPTYDANGNLTADGSNGYSYDAENRLVSATGAHAAALATIRWGACGR